MHYFKLRKSCDTVGVDSTILLWSEMKLESAGFVPPVGVLRWLTAGEECISLQRCPVVRFVTELVARQLWEMDDGNSKVRTDIPYINRIL